MFTVLQFLLSDVLFFILHITSSGSFPRPLSAQEERACLQRLKEGDPHARAELIEHNLRLVAHIIKKYYAAQNDQDDLISIGTIGLIKAIDSFDPDKGIRLSSYAARCVEKAMRSLRLFLSINGENKLPFLRNGKFGKGTAIIL